MRQDRFSVKGAEVLFAAAFTYAFTGVLVREVSPMWGDKAQVAARWLILFVALMVYSGFAKSKARVPRAKVKHAVGLGLTFALVVLFFTAAIERTTLANTLFTFYATNLVASFFIGTLLLGESVTAAKVIASVFALAGLSLYAQALFGGSAGIVLSVLAGLCAGMSNAQQKLLAGVDRTAVLRIQYGVGTLFSILVTLLSGEQIIRTFSLRRTVLTIVFAAVLMLGSNLLLYGYQHFDVNVATVILSTELIFGALFGWLFFGEVPKPHELAGGILIFTGSVIGSVNMNGRLHRPKS